MGYFPDLTSALIAVIKSGEHAWNKNHPAAMSGSRGGGGGFNVIVLVNSQTFNRFTGQKARAEPLLQLLCQLKLSTLHTPPGQKNHCGPILQTNDRHIALSMGQQKTTTDYRFIRTAFLFDTL